MSAFWRHRVDRTLKTVEDMLLAAARNGEALVIIVSANFTARHKLCSLRALFDVQACRWFVPCESRSNDLLNGGYYHEV